MSLFLGNRRRRSWNECSGLFQESQLKVTELRQYLKEKGMPGVSAFKKNELVEKIKLLHGLS